MTITGLSGPPTTLAIALSLRALSTREGAFSSDPLTLQQMVEVAQTFSEWLERHACWDGSEGELQHRLETRFGEAWASQGAQASVEELSESVCLAIALALAVPVRWDENRPLPFDVTVPHPVPNGLFTALRLQTVREISGDAEVQPFTKAQVAEAEPSCLPFVGVYGVLTDGSLDHIADRANWDEAVALVKALWPETVLPRVPPPDVTSTAAPPS